MKILRLLATFALWTAVFGLSMWMCGAVYFDGYQSKWLVILHVVAILGVLFCVKNRWLKFGVFAGLFCAVFVWWVSLKPYSDANWQPDVARTASAEIHGNEVTLHNVRNNEYRSESDYTPRWETRQVDISKITGLDIVVSNFGSPLMAHPLISFEIEGAPPLCFSIEARKKSDQGFSALGSIYRQFTLIFVVADERDVLRLRTNYRKDESVYLYRTTLTASQAQERFREYLNSINQLNQKPQWYNVITTNCTTSIRHQHPLAGRLPWDWRMLVNGKVDEMLFDRNAILTGGLDFAELKQRSLINTTAQAVNDPEDFSARIRQNLPTF